MNTKTESKFNPRTILVTGGCGFIGSNFIHKILSLSSPPRIINLDALTYAGNLDNLALFESDSNYFFVKGDIRDYKIVSDIFKEYKPDCVINFAAESHVDRSIESPQDFFETNVGGTLVLLRVSLEYGLKRFLQISTDEVYGSLGTEGFFTEKTPIAPNSPYSASKASADNFVRAYNHTYGLNTVITRCSNNYGPYQYPEKLIPLIISKAKKDLPLPIYGDGMNIRDWIFVDDHCQGIWDALRFGDSGDIFNFGGNSELTNIDLVKNILLLMKKPESLITFVEDRLGHDFRYAIDHSFSTKKLGWKPKVNFKQGLEKTLNWYIDNNKFMDKLTKK